MPELLLINEYSLGLPIPEVFSNDHISLWLKLPYTLFVLFLIPVYRKHWGVKNFLWFSDIALILSVPALWLESSLLASMLAVGVLLPEIYWNIELLFRLLIGKSLAGLTDYMFDVSRPLYLRMLSLFHVILPGILIFMLVRLGYDSRAVFYQTLLACIILFTTYKVTDPSRNINWVFGFGKSPQHKLGSGFFLVLVILAYIFLLFVPSHFLLDWIFN